MPGFSSIASAPPGKQAADELAAGLDRGPLHGIPGHGIFSTRDWPTAAGYRPWQNSIARQDATVVGAYVTLAAVFVGKTVTTQFASFDPPPTRNPWLLDRTPGLVAAQPPARRGMCLSPGFTDR